MGKGYFYEIMESNKCIREKRIESNKWTHKNSLDLVKLMDTVRHRIILNIQTNSFS